MESFDVEVVDVKEVRRSFYCHCMEKVVRSKDRFYSFNFWVARDLAR